MDTNVRVLEQLEEGDFCVVADWLKLGVIIDLNAGIAVVEDGVLNEVDHVILQL